jgi:hypothetical protein
MLHRRDNLRAQNYRAGCRQSLQHPSRQHRHVAVVAPAPPPTGQVASATASLLVAEIMRPPTARRPHPVG